MFRLTPGLIILSVLCVFLLSCSKKEEGSKNGKISVFVSVLPEKFIVDKIGGDTVDTSVMVPAGQDPHTYSPTPSQIMKLGNARVYFELGMPFENNITGKIEGSGSRIDIVDASKGIKRIQEAHGHEHKGQEREMDPHVWNSLGNLKIIASNICKALCDIRPENKKLYEENCKKLMHEADSMKNEISSILKPYKGRSFFVFHPAFCYFAHEFGLKQRPVEIEGKSPSPRQLAALIKKAISEKVKIIFVEPQFSEKSALAIAGAIDGAVVKIDPLPADPFENLRNVALQLKKSFVTENE